MADGGHVGQMAAGAWCRATGASCWCWRRTWASGCCRLSPTPARASRTRACTCSGVSTTAAPPPNRQTRPPSAQLTAAPSAQLTDTPRSGQGRRVSAGDPGLGRPRGGGAVASSLSHRTVWCRRLHFACIAPYHHAGWCLALPDAGRSAGLCAAAIAAGGVAGTAQGRPTRQPRVPPPNDLVVSTTNKTQTRKLGAELG